MRNKKARMLREQSAALDKHPENKDYIFLGTTKVLNPNCGRRVYKDAKYMTKTGIVRKSLKHAYAHWTIDVKKLNLGNLH